MSQPETRYATVGNDRIAYHVLGDRTLRGILIGSPYEFADRGTHELKGVPDRWQLYAVGGGRPGDPVRRPGPSGARGDAG